MIPNMTRVILLISTVALTGCVAGGMKPNYVLQPKDTKALTGKAGVISDIALTREMLTFKFTNTTSKTSKIIWDESAMIMPDGKAKKLLPIGAKYIDAGRSLPPEVVPAGASIDTGISPTDNLTVGSYGWAATDIVPCVVNPFGNCAPEDHYGKVLSMLITIENDGKKLEYRIDNQLAKNPEIEEAARMPTNQKHEPLYPNSFGGNGL